MHVIYFCSPGIPGRTVRDAYDRALAGLGDYAIVWLGVPGRSREQAAEALKFKRSGRILPTLLTQKPAPSRAGPSTVSLVVFSAGYAFAREVLKCAEDLPALDALVALDAIHSGVVAGNAQEPQLEPFAAYASRAAGSNCLFWLAHTDVPTPQTGAGAFASTTQCANALRHMAGEPRGNWYLRAYDEYPAAEAKHEHSAALSGWGAAFTAEALVPYLTARVQRRVSLPPLHPWQDPELSLGERCVAFSRSELDRGRLETDGPNAGPRIREYFAPAMRTINGTERKVGLTSGNWCAVGACFAERNARLRDEAPTLPYRCSGIEMQRDAARVGLWRIAESIRAGDYLPSIGDLVVLHRGAPGAWTRHVCRVETDVSVDGSYRTIDANKGDRWQLVERNIADGDLLGMVELPRQEHGPNWRDFFTLHRLSQRVILGETGLDSAIASLWEGCG